jgi:hypothetical protein
MTEGESSPARLRYRQYKSAAVVSCPGRDAVRSTASQNRDPHQDDGPRISSAPRRIRGTQHSVSPAMPDCFRVQLVVH